MRNSTLIGLLLGCFAIFGAFLLEGGSLSSLFLLPALLIVLGGTFAATMIGTSFEHFARLPRLIAVAIFPPRYDPQDTIETIVRFAALSRREGLLTLERRLGEAKHLYMRKLLQLAIDGVDPQSLRQIAENELYFIGERHQANIQLFMRMGGYSPTMGIIGTVMGLISTMAGVGGDPNDLIRHIASAFIATLWGIFMANIVWLPIGDKLKTLHEQEMQLLNMIVEGVCSVQLGEVPSVIRAHLISILPLEQQQRYLQSAPVSTSTPPAPVKNQDIPAESAG
jgi:chemotaxis protein MotA